MSGMKRIWLAGAGMLAALAGGLLAENIENPGFENGLEKWDAQTAPAVAFETGRDAAAMGESGLRVKVLSMPATGMLTSSRVPVEPGRAYRLGYWFGGGGGGPPWRRSRWRFSMRKGWNYLLPRRRREKRPARWRWAVRRGQDMNSEQSPRRRREPRRSASSR